MAWLQEIHIKSRIEFQPIREIQMISYISHPLNNGERPITTSNQALMYIPVLNWGTSSKSSKFFYEAEI